MEDYIPLTCKLTNWKPYTPQCVKMLLYITCQIYNVCFKDNMGADADVEFGCELMLIVAADDLINS